MDKVFLFTLQQEIEDLEQKLTAKKQQLEEALSTLSIQTDNSATVSKDNSEDSLPASSSEINNYSPPETKIALFRSLFRGREDVYAKRFESRKTGKSGYQPACRNE